MKYHSTLHINETIVEKEEPKEEDEKAAIPPVNVNECFLKRSTPILFSTNRGLHLRISSNTPAEPAILTSNSSQGNSTTSVINSTYNIAFCDLERWSKNRANTISLEDTFTIPKPPVVPSSAASGSLASASLRMFSQRSTSVRFNGYARFDVK